MCYYKIDFATHMTDPLSDTVAPDSSTTTTKESNSRTVRLLVAGSRTIQDYAQVCQAIQQGLQVLGLTRTDIADLISGHASGVDQLAERWARNEQPAIPITEMRPEWYKYGKGAGLRRNSDMVHIASAVICIWDEMKGLRTTPSSGTADTIRKARAMATTRQLPLYVTSVNKPSGPIENASDNKHARDLCLLVEDKDALPNSKKLKLE